MEWQNQHQLVVRAAMEAERARRALKISSYAPIDVYDVAMRFGCEVRFCSLPSLEGVYSPEPRSVIIVGSERPAGRRAYTCAHEFGHHIFQHGMRVEELQAEKSRGSKSAEEFLVDVFAGCLLMPQIAVMRALKDRSLSSSTITPDQIMALANFFGVGYTTIINHLLYTLRLLPKTLCTELLRVPRSEIKEHYLTEPKNDLVLCDLFWHTRSVDLETGDTLALPETVEVDGTTLNYCGDIRKRFLYRARHVGFSRAFCKKTGWAVNIRVAKKGYEGLAQHRFIEDTEDSL